jgi:hypothetical protein
MAVDVMDRLCGFENSSSRRRVPRPMTSYPITTNHHKLPSVFCASDSVSTTTSTATRVPPPWNSAVSGERVL